MSRNRIRHGFGNYLGLAEISIYSVLAVLLVATALAALVGAGRMLVSGFSHWNFTSETLRVLDQLLIVLMLVEILHTVRISIHSHVLLTEPFLVVGLIASIRRMLVITLEASTLTKSTDWEQAGASVFRAEMLELGLLGLLILVLVFSITLLRRSVAASETLDEPLSTVISD